MASRAPADATLTFPGERGPAPYAVTGAYGCELSDRWSEALVMQDAVRALWAEVMAEAPQAAPRLRISDPP